MNLAFMNIKKTLNTFYKNIKKLRLKFLSNRIPSNIFQIFTHTTEEERIFLYRLSSKLPKDSIIVEIGAYLGASTCRMVFSGTILEKERLPW